MNDGIGRKERKWMDWQHNISLFSTVPTCFGLLMSLERKLEGLEMVE